MGTKSSASELVGNTNGLQTQTAVRETSVSDALSPDTGLVEKDVDMQSAEAIASPTELGRPLSLDRTPTMAGIASEPSSVKVKKERIDLGLIDLCDDGSDLQEPIQTQHRAEEAPHETSSNGEVIMSTYGSIPETPSSVAKDDSQFADSDEEDELDESPNEGQTHTVYNTKEPYTPTVSQKKQ
ncbi:hypothetical protein ACEPAI_6489 [Sanghuangporus weigelae]